MKMHGKYIKSDLAALVAGVLFSFSLHADQSNSIDTGYLELWGNTLNEVSAMEPKWGKQGIEAFKEMTDAGVPVQFVDVRTPAEWDNGVIEDALLISVNDLVKPEVQETLPTDKETILGVYCKGGHRSAMALVLLQQLGYKNAIVMAGGMDAWIAAEYPIVEVSSE